MWHAWGFSKVSAYFLNATLYGLTLNLLILALSIYFKTIYIFDVYADGFHPSIHFLFFFQDLGTLPCFILAKQLSGT